MLPVDDDFDLDELDLLEDSGLEGDGHNEGWGGAAPAAPEPDPWHDPAAVLARALELLGPWAVASAAFAAIARERS